jgi:hypothetical protein
MVAGVRNRQRQDGDLLFSPHAKRHPGRDQNRERWARCQQIEHQRGGAHDLFDIVQNQQHRLGPEGRDDRIAHREIGPFHDIERPGDRRRNDRWIGNRRQRHEADHAARCHVGRRDIDRQARLADAARTGQRQ